MNLGRLPKSNTFVILFLYMVTDTLEFTRVLVDEETGVHGYERW